MIYPDFGSEGSLVEDSEDKSSGRISIIQLRDGVGHHTVEITS